MNDIVSKLRKAGFWMWNQKEKMFLFVLLAVLLFRAYVVIINPPDINAIIESETVAAAATPPKAPAPRPGGAPAAAPNAPITAGNVPLPDPRPGLPRAEDFRPLIRQNPFTIYGIVVTTGARGETTEEKIDVTLSKIIKWNDGSYRAELTTKVSGRPKRYAEGESFESYKVMEIDAVNNTVTIYSTGHDKTFTLTMPGT
ncbi:MAG TPA: hypothetical protein PK869_12635 [Candidatus Hydrogenedentes bacterium]|nr:hypothetical protein [Candidatus Hydrogenedentota bacterium]